MENEMKKGWLSFVSAVAAGAVLAAGWETAAEPRLYGVTFADYAEGEELSNKGAIGGTWKDSSSGTTAAGTVDGRKCMKCDSASLLFSAYPGLDGPKVSKASVALTGSPGLANLFETDKAAFAIRSPAEGDTGDTVFAGWSGKEWCDLYGSVVPMTNKWYDISVWFAVSVDKVRQVQYRLKVGDSYEPLHTKDGSVWLDSGVRDVDAVVREIEIFGSGAFDQLSGRELPSPGLSVHCK